MLSLLDKKPFFVLAPMDDVTDTVFRRIVHECAPADLYFTEFVNVDGLMSPGRDKVIRKLNTSQDKGPIYAQIWGKTPEHFEAVARQISSSEIPGFAGIDINMGCPDKTVVKNECCSALAQPHLRDKAVEIIKATQKGAGDMPVTIKTRLGFNDIDFSWHELLLKQKPAILTVHVRTTKQMSKVPAQWEAITEIIKLRDTISPETKIVLNGDINNRAHGEELVRKYNVDGVMIGRGIFDDPFAFATKSPWETFTREQRIALYRRQIELFAETWKKGERPIHTLNKFCKIYINNFDGAKELREKLMAAKSAEELLKLV